MSSDASPFCIDLFDDIRATNTGESHTIEERRKRGVRDLLEARHLVKRVQRRESGTSLFGEFSIGCA